MMVARLSVVAVALILLAGDCAADGADSSRPEIQQAESLARKLGSAVVAGDFATVMDHTYSKLVELMGGRARAIESSKAEVDDLKTRGLEIVEYLVSPASQVVLKDGVLYAIFPTRLVMTTPKGRGIAEGYLLAVSENNGASWGFLDGAGLENPEVRSAVLPNLPSEVVLPQIPPPSFERQ